MAYEYAKHYGGNGLFSPAVSLVSAIPQGATRVMVNLILVWNASTIPQTFAISNDSGTLFEQTVEAKQTWVLELKGSGIMLDSGSLPLNFINITNDDNFTVEAYGGVE